MELVTLERRQALSYWQASSPPKRAGSRGFWLQTLLSQGPQDSVMDSRLKLTQRKLANSSSEWTDPIALWGQQEKEARMGLLRLSDMESLTSMSDLVWGVDFASPGLSLPIGKIRC